MDMNLETNLDAFVVGKVLPESSQSQPSAHSFAVGVYGCACGSSSLPDVPKATVEKEFFITELFSEPRVSSTFHKHWPYAWSVKLSMASVSPPFFTS